MWPLNRYFHQSISVEDVSQSKGIGKQLCLPEGDVETVLDVMIAIELQLKESPHLSSF